ncbi:hypothetical protein PTTG_06933 [Puccinia triticina 1-1 BBBD Race 1]|uniref:Uncharacterized protein n=1 Tax=Puccinia triticina (isolate 1-1 / race 1 (BBBD)) TaxID=630390 RepID=A0A180GAI5_PUCT1|nr:hypothetical protein PTTG_06933 [Puccinia triticina 1-1 BBBD Race 1]
MTEKKSSRPRFPYKNSFNGFCGFSSADSPHSLAEVTIPIPSEKQTESPKKNRLKSKKHRGGKKNVWSPSHYVPTSFTLSLETISPKQPSPRSQRRWSSKPVPSETAKSMSSIKCNDSGSFKHQAKGVFRKIFLSAKKSLIPSKTKLTRKASSSTWRSKSKNASEDPDTAKPKISYPMKLHNSDLTFVTTQDPWESSVRSSGLHRRATVGTARSHNRSASCTESRFSTRQPSQEGKRLSFGAQHRVSKDLTCNLNPHLRIRPEAVPSLNRSAGTDRPKSASHARSSSGDSHSKRSQNQSFPPNRGSLYRHPPTRPLSLSHHSRRNSVLVAGDENPRRSYIEGASRRSSMASSNLTSTTNQLRQSWTTGRAILDPSTPQGSGLSCSERSSVITSGTDQKSISSYRRPARNDWAGVIEEDITLTLMGCPESLPTTKRASRVAAVRSTPPPIATSSGPAPTITSPIPSPLLALSLSSAEDASPENFLSEDQISHSEDASLENLSLDDTPRKPLRSEHTPRKLVHAEETPRKPVASEDASSLPPSVDAPPTTTSPSASITQRSASPSATPPCVASSPTPPSTPSPPPSIRSIPLPQIHKPLSLLFESRGSSQIDGIDGQSKRRSDWYSELMTTVEQSISKLN